MEHRTREADQRTLEWVPAGTWLRLVNWLVDQFAIGLVGGAVYWPARCLLSALAGQSVPETGEGDPLASCIAILAYFGYYILLESQTGRTFGKLLTGTSVLTYGRDKPSFRQIVGRTFARLIPFDWLSVWMCGSFWHDSLSRTAVLRRVRPSIARAMHEAEARMDEHRRELAESIRREREQQSGSVR